MPITLSSMSQAIMNAQQQLFTSSSAGDAAAAQSAASLLAEDYLSASSPQAQGETPSTLLAGASESSAVAGVLYDSIESLLSSAGTSSAAPNSLNTPSGSVSGAPSGSGATASSNSAASSSASYGAEGTPFVSSSAASGSALQQFLTNTPGAQAVNVGDGRVAVFSKNAIGSGFGVFNADGSKACPPGDGLQPIKAGENHGLGTMTLSGGAYLNFDTNGITVDPTVKNNGEPLGYDTSGNIGVGVGTAAQTTIDGDPFYNPNNVSSESGNVAAGALYPSNGTPSASDIQQRGIGDCYVDASLASMAETPAGQQMIKNAITQTGDNPPAYSVKMYDPSGKPVSIAVGGTDPQGVTGSNGQTNWASIMESAFTKYNTTYHVVGNSSASGVDSITSGGTPDKFLKAFTGSGSWERTSTYANQSDAQFAQDLNNELQSGQFCVGGTTTGGTASNGAKILDSHAYSIVGVDTAAGTVTVRNPWGNTPSDPNYSASEGNGNDGSITVPIADFRKLFTYVNQSGNINM